MANSLMRVDFVLLSSIGGRTATGTSEGSLVRNAILVEKNQAAVTASYHSKAVPNFVNRFQTFTGNTNHIAYEFGGCFAPL